MNHPDLLESKGLSLTKIFGEWLRDKKIERVFKENGLDFTKESIISDLKEIVGKGLSLESFKKCVISINNQKSYISLASYVWNSCANGSNMGAIK